MQPFFSVNARMYFVRLGKKAGTLYSGETDVGQP